MSKHHREDGLPQPHPASPLGGQGPLLLISIPHCPQTSVSFVLLLHSQVYTSGGRRNFQSTFHLFHLHRAARKENFTSLCISQPNDDDDDHLINGPEIYPKSLLLAFKLISFPWPSMEWRTAKGHLHKPSFPIRILRVNLFITFYSLS